MLHYPLFIILGLLPSFIWLLFYLRKDHHPEPNSMVVRIFLYGMIITLPVAAIELGFGKLLETLNLTRSIVLFGLNLPIALLIYFVIGVAISEELAKYLVVKLRILKDPEFDEPVDAMIYMIIVGLGFAAVENILILFQLAQPFLAEKTILALAGRFIGATFLHTLCSANIGFFLALFFFRAKGRLLLLLGGFGVSIILHGIYNIVIKTMEGWPRLVVLAILLIGLFIVVLLEFNKVKKLLSVCKVH